MGSGPDSVHMNPILHRIPLESILLYQSHPNVSFCLKSLLF